MDQSQFVADETNNIGIVCPKCVETRKMVTAATQRPVDAFMGHYVKLGFPCQMPATATREARAGVEHMWVEVIGIAEHPEEELQGRLANDPVYCDCLCGDIVEFSRHEIEEVMEPD